MKYHSNMILLVIIASSLMSCDKLEDYNTNPHKTSEVTPGMLATRVILNIAQQNTGFSKTYLESQFSSKHIIWMEGANSGQYNNWQRSDFSGIQVLTNVDKMVESAPEDWKDAYMGVRHFVRVFKLLDLTLRVGDIPYNDAFKGESDNNFRPKYDTQKDVFLGLLNELDEADKLFQKAKNNFAGDPVYKGDVAKWRKLVNSYQLNVLMHLYKKENEADIRLKQRFQDVASRPLFESNADNFQMVHSATVQAQIYPWNKDNSYVDYNMLSSVLVDSLKKFQDYRLFCFAAPTAHAVSVSGLSAAAPDFDAYTGGDPLADWTTVLQPMHSASPRKYSMMNARYRTNVGEPLYQFSYADVKFLLAEACVRGFITGDARQYYEDGIRASMEFTGRNTPSQVSGREITPEYVEDYLNHPGVLFETTPQRQIAQIGTQRYISMFLQAPWQGVWQLRRINAPYIPINPETNLNLNDKTKLPVRWMYPSHEFTYNLDNVNEAIQRQFGGNDSPDELMWILK